jgi:hypothetical protein
VSQVPSAESIDRLTAEIATALALENIETLVLKGPVIARWLYPGEVRPYSDSDLMIAPEDWVSAVGVLEYLGFGEGFRARINHPRMESSPARKLKGTPFLRGGDIVDLHSALHGLEGDPTMIWTSLLERSEHQTIGGVELRVPARDAVLLHICLHAAQHLGGKRIEDLRRAIRRADGQLWAQALELARTYEGVAQFAWGLQLVPEGQDLVSKLGIENIPATAQDLRQELARQRVPMLEGVHALLTAQTSLREKLCVVASELFPRPDFMRWWSPWARHNGLGLLAAYVWRPVWLMVHLPRATLTWCQIRRRMRSAKPTSDR